MTVLIKIDPDYFLISFFYNFLLLVVYLKNMHRGGDYFSICAETVVIIKRVLIGTAACWEIFL
jgi:hypothetical protein